MPIDDLFRSLGVKKPQASPSAKTLAPTKAAHVEKKNFTAAPASLHQKDPLSRPTPQHATREHLGPPRPSALDNWLETKQPPVDKIPAWSNNPDGDKQLGPANGRWDAKGAVKPTRFRDGTADPVALEKSRAGEESPEPTPAWKRILPALGPLGNVAHDGRAGATATNIIGDIFSRVGSARKDGADNPFDSTDDPVFEYTTPEGNKYRSDERQLMWKLGDGTSVSDADLRKARKSNPIWLSADDPRRENWTGDVDAAGNPIIYRSFDLPDNRRVAREHMPLGEENLQDWFYQFPDGTVVMNGDGTIPEAAQSMHTKQVNANWAGVVDPRPPWQDTAENNFWDDDYDPSQKALSFDETIPWLIDMNLSSLPYYFSSTRLPAAISAAAPYLRGIDGSTYQPTGRWFDDLDHLGDGTYEDKELTRAQLIGGALAPPVDMLAERASGSAFGGIEKILPKAVSAGPVGRFLSDTALGRVLSGVVTEGAEEVASSPFQQLQQDSWRDFGREKVWNDVTGKFDYDQNSPRGTTTGETLAGDSLAGGILGGTMVGGAETPAALARLVGRGPRKPPRLPTVPVAPPTYNDDRLSTLDTHFRED